MTKKSATNQGPNRIATVKATGSRYVVQRLEIGKTPAEDKVHVWGEVVGMKGASTRHDGSKTFLRDAVEVAEVPKTPALCAELFEQACRAREASGHVLQRRGRNVVDLGTPEEAPKALAAEERRKLLARAARDPKAFAALFGRELTGETPFGFSSRPVGGGR